MYRPYSSDIYHRVFPNGLTARTKFTPAVPALDINHRVFPIGLTARTKFTPAVPGVTAARVPPRVASLPGRYALG